MKTRYIILIIIGVIFAICIIPIITINFIYANDNELTPVFEMLCPFVTIPNDFEVDKIGFPRLYSNSIKQLEMTEYSILNTCAKIKDPSLVLKDPRYEDTVNNKGCPQFCPKKNTGSIGDYISDEWNPKWGPVPPVSKTEIKEIIVNRGYIDLLANAGDYLRETKNIHIVTIGTDHEKEKTIRVGIDETVLTDYTIKDIEREIRKIIGHEIGITIKYEPPLMLR